MIARAEMELALKAAEEQWGDSPCLPCPSCGGEYVRITDVEALKATDKYSATFAGHEYKTPFRGDATVIAYCCENGCKFIEILSFHKGMTIPLAATVRCGDCDGGNHVDMERKLGQSQLFESFH